MDQRLITLGGFVINFNDIQQLYFEEGEKDKDYINYEYRLTAKTEKLGKVMITCGDKAHCANTFLYIAQKLTSADLCFICSEDEE